MYTTFLTFASILANQLNKDLILLSNRQFGNTVAKICKEYAECDNSPAPDPDDVAGHFEKMDGMHAFLSLFLAENFAEYYE